MLTNSNLDIENAANCQFKMHQKIQFAGAQEKEVKKSQNLQIS